MQLRRQAATAVPAAASAMNDLIISEAVLPNLKAGSKKQALQELARKAAELTGQNEREIGRAHV